MSKVLTAVEDGDGAGDSSNMRFDEDGNALGTSNDARVALLNQINDNNDELRADEYEDVNDDGTTEKFVVKPADGEAEDLVDETDQIATNEDIADGFTNPEKFVLKVNGRDVEVSREELIARAQKIEAADQYLAEAARIRQDAMKEQPSRQAAVQSVDDDLALARAIQMGNEDEAVAAIRQLRSTGPSSDDLAKTVDERLTFRDAINTFNTEYKDIISNPSLNAMAQQRDQALLQQGDSRPYVERYRAIGEEIRAFVRETAKAAGFVEPTSAYKPDTSKADRKAAAPSTPKTAGAKAPNTQEQEREETTSEVIADMSRARGGPQWMQGASS